MSATATASPPIRDYGDKVATVEPGGVERIPLAERHGSPLQLLWTWTSPNMEFATVAVGILGPLYFGLNFWESFAAIVLGTVLGSLSLGVLSTWGPTSGLCQMVLSRSAFGFIGNWLPAGLNALTAGIGWFAVNSISGALALHGLTKLPNGVCLTIVVLVQLAVAFFGHNLVHLFERYAFPVLTVIFVIASIVVLSKSHPGMAASGKTGSEQFAGFLILFGATFGYAAGWNPYASDYTRYLKPETSPGRTLLWSALGVTGSCVLLETAGAAIVTALGPDKAAVDPSSLTSLLPTWIGKLTLLAICLGAISANAINIYSGSLSFMALGVKLPTHAARAAVALIFAIIGFIVAYTGLKNAGTNYEDFLLVIAYWIAPWLAVVFVDRWMRRGRTGEDVVRDATDTRFQNWAGPIAMIVAGVVSIWLFSNQTKYVGMIPKHHPAVGDLTFEVGFVLAGVLYYVLRQALKPRHA